MIDYSRVRSYMIYNNVIGMVSDEIIEQSEKTIPLMGGYFCMIKYNEVIHFELSLAKKENYTFNHLEPYMRLP